MSNELKISLHVENEHGVFDIKVGDRVTIKDAPDSIIVSSCSFTTIKTKFGYNYETKHITSVRPLYTWINSLGKEDKAWKGDELWFVSISTKDIQRSNLLQITEPGTPNTYHFSKKEDAEKYLASLNKITVEDVVNKAVQTIPSGAGIGIKDFEQWEKELTKMINTLIEQEK